MISEAQSEAIALTAGVEAGDWPPSRTFGLLAAIYLCRPTRGALEDWLSVLRPKAPSALLELRSALAAIDLSDASALEELLCEHTRLFVGPYRLAAPPWESVYTSPKRLLMQEAHDAVLACYGEAGVAVGDPDVLADHVGAEMSFLAVLHERAESGRGGPEAPAAFERFLSAHVRRWVPAFTTDLECAAKSFLYRALARATRLGIGGAIPGSA